MAFQNALLPELAAVTVEIWPSVANSLATSWRASTTLTRPASSPSATSQSGRTSTLPAFLRNELPSRNSSLPNHLPTNDIRSTIATMPSFALAAAANPLAQRPTFRLAAQRTTGALPRLFSTIATGGMQRRAAGIHTASRFQAPAVPRPASAQPSLWIPLGRAIGLTPYTSLLQYRNFNNGGISRNMLANLEAAANRNPASSTAQNAFYQVLLKANMPAIIVERYQSGRYAKNQAVEEAYAKALSLLTGNKNVDIGSNEGHSSGLSQGQLQAISQAVAANAHGGNIAVSAKGSGAKDGPIHVVVDESIATTIFKWIRFFLVFGFVCYLSLIVVSMVVESFNTLKRTGTARADAEVKAEAQKARFADVHGCDEAKEELQEIVEFLKNPDKFSTLGGKLPKGVLLVGPPGTGKTLLARAVAGEAGVPFFYMSGSEFDEIYVGVGAKRVRDLFSAARAKSPAIIFIDELDAIGGKRNTRDATYVKQTLNQLLTELDGFDQSSQVIILAATNFPKLLDKALTRPGRFDRHVAVDLPDVRGRLAILKHHAKKVKMSEGINLQELAQGTSGLSGAELENIVNSAAINASKNKSMFVTMRDLIWAKDKVIMGAEKKTMVISEKEKLMTAYHEAGHALAALYTTAQPMPLYKVTILPRGMSLGHTAFLPQMDKYSWSSSDYTARIDCSMGGKVAEEIVYGNDMVTSGVSADLNNATDLAFQMVASFGMGGGGLAPMDFGSRYNSLSSATKELVEKEVQKLLSVSYDRTKELLRLKRKELDLLAQALVDYETLDKEEVLKVIKGEKLTDRIKMPRSGQMTIPRPPSPLESLPPIAGGQQGEDAGGSTEPPPPPAPPASV
ncbi:Mitochondrial inner membrane i-AAA protease supercomplex subunit YME1 [Cytospora mali]|uniref:Mitochondrial inner membrane i-AAA protease supercomplex subunit YME1 n=1 Tax=Cytospora mali TaxID=578113 RepID=A0A194VUQ6_CYTMA|nr:Mitochondrial inner membrane i-AAA protease supercomplex subunit YME1 [Valsa mali]